jgi:WD40 repeat protein
LAFTPAGRLVTCGRDGALLEWDPRTGRRTRTLVARGEPLASVAVSLDGKRLAAATGERFPWRSDAKRDPGVIRVRDAASGEVTHTLEGHTGPVTAVCFSPDGSRLASAGWDGTARVWDPDTGAVLRVLDRHAPRNKAVLCLAFSPDGELLAAGDWEGAVTVWRTRTGEAVQTFRPPGGAAGVAFGPGGRTLLACSDKGSVVWDLSDGRAVRSLGVRSDTGVVWAAGGSRLITAGNSFAPPCIWDVETGQELLPLRGLEGRSVAVALSADGGLIAAGDTQGRVRVWRATLAAEK